MLDRASDGNTVEYMNGGLDYKLRQTSSSGGSLYYLQDHLGSTAALTDSSGSVVERQQYSPFGESSGSSLTRFGFTGRESDPETGLLYYRARWYDPAQGRFISQDPAGVIGGFNFYAYAGNNPLSFVDPMGLSWKSFLEGLAVAGVTSFFVALGMAALFSALTCATAGTALAVLPPILAAILGAESAYEIAMEIKALLTEDMCPDELHYRIGALIGRHPGRARWRQGRQRARRRLLRRGHARPHA